MRTLVSVGLCATVAACSGAIGGHDDGAPAGDPVAGDRTAGDRASGDRNTGGDRSAGDDTGGDGTSGGDSAPTGYGFHTDLFIDGSLTQDCAATYDITARSCGGGTATAYQSFASARAAAASGVRFLIRAGTHNEVLHLDISGAPGAYVGYCAYETEEVVIANVNSQENDEDYGPIWLDHVSYNLVRGLTVRGSVGFLRAVDAHHNVIEDCDFDGSTLYPGASKRGGIYMAWSNHNRLASNRVYQGTDALALVHSDHNMVVGNQFELAGHNIFDVKCGCFNVIRGNDFTNPNQKLGSVFDCESATVSWHGNGDRAQSEAVLDRSKHNLIENNAFHHAEDYYSTSGGNGIQYAGQEGIIRRNVFYAANVGIGMQHYDSEALYGYGNRIFHNVFHDNRCGGLSVRGPDGNGRIEDNEYKNNILWNNQGWDEDCAGTSPAQILYRSSVEGHRWVRNAIASAAGDTLIRAEFGSEYSLATFPEAAAFERTLEVDPQFTNESTHQYTLGAGSPLEDEGDFLTTVTSASGSGTQLVVADAGYFYDGFGIAGEVGDLVQLEGQSTTVRIVAVDYTTNAITVDQPLTWTQGDGLSLAYDGTKPDIGAFE